MSSHAIDLNQYTPLDVGLLTWALPPEKSGLSRAAREIAQAVAQAGARMRVFTMDRTGREQDGAVEIIGCAISPDSMLGRLRGLAALGHLAGPMAFRRAVMAEHRRRPFDVVEATNWYAPAMALTLPGGVPVVTRNSTPNAVSIDALRTMRDRMDRWAAIAIERLAARRSTGLISNTPPHGIKIAELYRVPPPGPDHATIGLSLPPAIVERGRVAACPTDGPINLLFVGRNEPRKGFDALADALPILAARDLPFRMTIVGLHDRELPDWPEAVRRRVTAHHRVDETTLHDLLGAAHVVVAPSRYESFGLVYQEAMAFGRPIVACAVDPSARLFVGETGAGLLAERCDGPALAAALVRVIEDGGLRAGLAAASRRAGGRFTRETLGRETLAVYRSAIGSKPCSKRASSSRLAPSDDIAA